MWGAIARWNDRRRLTLSKYREAAARHDAWPETSVFIWLLAGPPFLVDVLGRPLIGAMGKEFALLALMAFWVLGGAIVAAVATVWRRRCRASRPVRDSAALPPHLFFVIALLSWGFVVIATARAAPRWHGGGQHALIWVSVTAAWLAATYCLAEILWRTFHAVRDGIRRLH